MLRVVPAFDVAEDGSARFSLRRKAVSHKALNFERREETFGYGVFVGIAARSHRGLHTKELAALAECKRAILRALTGVMYHVGGTALRRGHLQRAQEGRVYPFALRMNCS